MNQISISEYISKNNLSFDELISLFKSEKRKGYKYFRKPLDELKPNSTIQLFEYGTKADIECISQYKLPLLPFPIKHKLYNKFDNKFKLLEELAVSKVAFIRKGYRPPQINIRRSLINRTVQLIYKYYEYEDPYQSEKIIWIDLKPDLIKTLNKCTENNIDGIINGLLIKTG
jgi:hypothetical protein